jgi:prepilin-type N-terminal cleavage/methylation domain-containing protein/prepilin-type processing-associated H-X9-DG protein
VYGLPARGFTLVELLAVLAIIGTLIGLLLPAVQRVRESGRQMQCSNNLKQMGLAIANYEEARKRFPPGNEQLGRRYHAWSSFILPFLDQSVVSDRIDYKKKWNDAGGNSAIADMTIPTYVCPSGMKTYPGKQDYGGVLGAYINRDGDSLATINGRDLRHLYSGVLYATGDERYDDLERYPPGMLPAQQPRQSATASQISDGLSKTLLVTEGVDREQEGEEDTLISGSSRWASGSNCFPLDSRVINNPEIDGFRSLHFGGIYGLFADGHVAFIEERVDAPVLIAISTKSGGETETAGL